MFLSRERWGGYGKRKVKYRKREGQWSHLWWDNRKLQSKGTYKNGLKVMEWVYYHDNGQLRRNGVYKNGKREGLWKFYDESPSYLPFL